MLAYAEGLPIFHSNEQLDLGRSSDILRILSVHPQAASSSLRRWRGSLYRRRPWDDDRRLAELDSMSPGTQYQTVWRSSSWTLVCNRPAVRRRCFDRLAPRSRLSRLGRSRCRDDTQVSSSFSPASFRRTDLDDSARSNVSRRLRRRSRSRRLLNYRQPLHLASKELCCCQPCRPGRTPADGRNTVKKARKDDICSELSPLGDMYVWSLQARQRFCRSSRGLVTVETVGRMMSYIYNVTIGLMI